MTQGPDGAPLVSLILTTYERPELAKQAVKSMADQTYENTEIIIVEDSGRKTIENWVRKKYEEITFIRHDQNKGLAAARNTGIDAASGKYVAFLDDDDEWLPKKTKKQVTKAEDLLPNRNLGVIYCGIKDVFEHKSHIEIRLPKNNGNLKKEIVNKGARTLSSSYLFLKEAIDDAGEFDESLPSSIDHDIWMSLATAGYSVEIIKEPLVIKHHSDNREEITSNTEKRIVGVRKYTEKWKPVYQQWFGEAEGKRYAKEYFTDVVGRLAVKKLFNLRFNDALRAIIAVVKYNPRYLPVFFYLSKHTLILGGSRLLPQQVKTAIKNFFKKIKNYNM